MRSLDRNNRYGPLRQTRHGADLQRVLTPWSRLRCGIPPVSIDSSLSHRRAFETSNKIVEDGELVSAEKVVVRVLVDPVPDVDDSFVEISFDSRVEIALGVTSDVNRPLVGQDTYPVNIGCTISAHFVAAGLEVFYNRL